MRVENKLIPKDLQSIRFYRAEPRTIDRAIDNEIDSKATFEFKPDKKTYRSTYN